MIAVSLHAVMIAAAFGGLSGASMPVSDEGDDATTVFVTLAGKIGAQHSAQAASSEPMSELIKRVDANAHPSTPVIVTSEQRKPAAQANLDQLMQKLDPTQSKDPPGSRGAGQEDRGGQAASDKTIDGQEKAQKLKKSAVAALLDGPDSAGSLWAQIEPCWRRMPGVAKVAVTLDITLNSAGRLKTPPQIIRPGSRVADEAALSAEARALAAVAACGPYRLGLFSIGSATRRVRFTP